MDLEKLLNPNSYTEKTTPILTDIYRSLCVTSAISDWSEQRTKLYDENEDLYKRRDTIYQSLSAEQRDVIEAAEKAQIQLDSMELSETFCASFRLGALLMLELLGGSLK